MTTRSFNGGDEVPRPTNRRHIHNCDIGVYHRFSSTFHMSHRWHGHVLHCSIGTSGTFIQNRALSHVPVPDKSFVCHLLDSTTPSVGMPHMPDTWTLTSFSGAARHWCSQTFLKLTAYIPSVWLSTKTIFRSLLKTTVLNDLDSVFNLAETTSRSQSLKNLSNIQNVV